MQDGSAEWKELTKMEEEGVFLQNLELKNERTSRSIVFLKPEGLAYLWSQLLIPTVTRMKWIM